MVTICLDSSCEIVADLHGHRCIEILEGTVLKQPPRSLERGLERNDRAKSVAAPSGNALLKRRPNLLLGLLAALLRTSCMPGRTAAPFHNPLLEVDGADPWLQYYDGNYYLTATQWTAIRMWKSPTLAGLANVAPVTIWSDSNPTRCCEVWAPEFHLLDGPNGPRWYVYYSAGSDGTLANQRMHVLESSGTDPLGPYTYKSRIFDPSNDGWAIDGSILKMPDNKLYYLFSSWVGQDQNVFIAPMSDPWTISGPRVLISKPAHAWEKSVANVNEAPEVLQHDGKTFIIYSASACWGPDYKLGMLTYNGGDVLNPSSWVKHPTPVFERSDENSVFAPGHNGFFTSPDGKENWIVYHANSAADQGCRSSRTTRVQKFTWNADGTPNFGVPLALDTPVTPPSGERDVTAERADATYYTIVDKQSSQCLQGATGATHPQQAACGAGAEQQWALDYLANGYYRLLNRSSGRALEVAQADGSSQASATIQASAWTHAPNQQWRFAPEADGWLRLESRSGGRFLDTGSCGTGNGELQEIEKSDTDCQQFRLQPATEVSLFTYHSSKMVAIEKASTDDGAVPVLAADAKSADRHWKIVPQEQGFVQIMSIQSNKCLSIVTAAADTVEQRACTAEPNQQWCIDHMNNGTVRIVSRPSGKVLEVMNCLMGDGVKLRQWVSLNNDCQRFRIQATGA